MPKKPIIRRSVVKRSNNNFASTIEHNDGNYIERRNLDKIHTIFIEKGKLYSYVRGESRRRERRRIRSYYKDYLKKHPNAIISEPARELFVNKRLPTKDKSSDK